MTDKKYTLEYNCYNLICFRSRFNHSIHASAVVCRRPATCGPIVRHFNPALSDSCRIQDGVPSGIHSPPCCISVRNGFLAIFPKTSSNGPLLRDKVLSELSQNLLVVTTLPDFYAICLRCGVSVTDFSTLFSNKGYVS